MYPLTMNTLTSASSSSATSSTARVSTFDVTRSTAVVMSTACGSIFVSPTLDARSDKMSWWMFNSRLHVCAEKRHSSQTL